MAKIRLMNGKLEIKRIARIQGMYVVHVEQTVYDHPGHTVLRTQFSIGKYGLRKLKQEITRILRKKGEPNLWKNKQREKRN